MGASFPKSLDISAVTMISRLVLLATLVLIPNTSCTMIGATVPGSAAPQSSDSDSAFKDVGTNVLDSLENQRRKIEAPITSNLSMSLQDAGSLEWPMDGDLIYRFGEEQRPNGLVLQWNGIGISGSPGKPVHSTREGVVVLAGPFEGYGPTVVLSHGSGFYSLYLYLEELKVVEGDIVNVGHVVGTSGGKNTAQEPHIEFQLRVPVDGAAPEAQDPLKWLKPKAGR